MRSTLFIWFLLNVWLYQAQQKSIPLEQFYTQHFLKASKNQSIESFFPANETQLNLTAYLEDSSDLYYDFHVWFLRKHWLEVNQKEGFIHISPLVNFAYGKGNSLADSLPIYRNTRGVFMEGALGDKFSFNFIFCENQARFMRYESDYFNMHGENYVINGNYSLNNAVIPAGGRTKDFKTNAFDYAFSMGSFSYQARKNLRFDVGNNQHFIGTGYRSLFLSDNAFLSPYARMNWKINSKWSYQLLYRRNKNLFRKPSTTSIESVYENKFFAASYLTYKPVERFSISLFSSGNQLITDSISKYPLQAQMLVPVPLMSNDLLFSSSKINGITGLNLDFAFNNLRIYAQYACDKFNLRYLSAFQIGMHFFDVFTLKNLDFQIEYNRVPDDFYAHQNQKLAYSHYNLPAAHPKGNNFDEFIFIGRYNYKAAYILSKSMLYLTKGGTDSVQFASNSIFSADKTFPSSLGSTFVQDIELGLRFNKRYNPTLFMQVKIRSSVFADFHSTYVLFLCGLKVNLFNQYLDF